MTEQLHLHFTLVIKNEHNLFLFQFEMFHNVKNKNSIISKINIQIRCWFRADSAYLHINVFIANEKVIKLSNYKRCSSEKSRKTKANHKIGLKDYSLKQYVLQMFLSITYRYQ